MENYEKNLILNISKFIRFHVRYLTLEDNFVKMISDFNNATHDTKLLFLEDVYFKASITDLLDSNLTNKNAKKRMSDRIVSPKKRLFESNDEEEVIPPKKVRKEEDFKKKLDHLDQNLKLLKKIIKQPIIRIILLLLKKRN